MKRRILAMILIAALVLSAFMPAATAREAEPPSGLQQAMQLVAQAMNQLHSEIQFSEHEAEPPSRLKQAMQLVALMVNQAGDEIWPVPFGNDHTVVLEAGIDGIFPDTVDSFWERSLDGSTLTGIFPEGTDWEDVVFPEPEWDGDPADPEQVFDGWLPAPPADGDMVDANYGPFVAQWRLPLTHEITLQAGPEGTFAGVSLSAGWNLGTVPTYITRTEDEGTNWSTITFPIPNPAIPADGYEHEDWDPAHPGTGVLVASAYEFTAQWDPATTFTITLNAGLGGTFTGVSLPAEWILGVGGTTITRTVVENTPWAGITFPEPVRGVATDGYIRDGWNPVRPTGNVIDDETFTAQWRQPATFTITLNAGLGGEFTSAMATGGWILGAGGTTLTRTVPENTPWTSIIFPTPVRVAATDGHAFTGWDPVRPGTGNVTNFNATAQWAPPRTITLNAGTGGTFPVAVPADWVRAENGSSITRTVPHGTAWNTITFPEPVRIVTGDSFIRTSWDPAQPTTGAIETNFTSTAQWEAPRVITFDLDGGNIGNSTANAVHTIPVGGNIALHNIPANPVKTGYIFFGWLETTPAGNQTLWERNEALVTHINAATGSRTFTAEWRTSRTITFNFNGGNNDAANMIHTVQAANHVAPNFGIALANVPQNPSRAGHVFLGWLETTPTGNQVHWERNDAFVTYLRGTVGDRVFTAQWGTSRAITFDLAGGHLADYAIANVVHTIPAANDVAPTFGITLANIPADPERAGYTFTGWLETTPTGNDTRFQRNEAFVTHIRGTVGNRTYTAQWEQGRVPVSGDHRAFLIGFPDNTMRPQAELTRAEAATIFFRLIDDGFRAQPNVWSTTNNFADVQSDNWFNNAVSTMSRLDVIRGVTTTTYAPHRSVTNGEFFAMLARFNRFVDEDETISVNNPAHWAAAYARALEELNLISGFSNNPTRLDAPITRAFVAELINRAVTERVVYNRDDLINTGALRRSWTDLPSTSPNYLHMVMAGHTVEYDIINTDTAGEWNGIRWTRIVRHIDWRVLEGPNANPLAILQAVEDQQNETETIERNALVEASLPVEPSV